MLGIPVWGYFFEEGDFGNDGVAFALVQTATRGDNYVKPSALVVMEASQQLAGRQYPGSPSVPIPLTYEADFEPIAGASCDLAAIGTQGLGLTAQVDVRATGNSPVGVRVTYRSGKSRTYQPKPSRRPAPLHSRGRASCRPMGRGGGGPRLVLLAYHPGPVVSCTRPGSEGHGPKGRLRGYAGGGVPSFWPNTAPLTMTVHAIDVYRAHQAATPFKIRTSSPVTTTNPSSPIQ